MTQVAASISSGGLVLTWRPGVDLECFISKSNNISAWCYSDPPPPPPNSPWILSCVYGPPKRSDRRVFWDSFAAIGDGFEASWLCISDFNSVINQSEKTGGRPVSSSSKCPFRRFIDHFGMIDVGFARNPFTWSNNRTGLENIKERLDRGLASPSWVLLHPNYSLIHLPAHNSDHNPISFNTNSTSYFLPRPFRFEEFWSKDPSCEQVIELAWQKYIPPYPDNCLPVKLNHTKIALLKWNSLHFGNIHKKIKETLNLIDVVQQATPSPTNFDKEVSLKLDLNNLLVKEESLWKSKSRETWLTCRDLNTKYFHTSTLIRRRANAINFLKLDSGTGVFSRGEIGGNLIAHFSNLFTTSNPTIEPELLDLFSPVISEEDNVFLCSIPGEAEVLEALDSLGPTKAPGPDGFIALFYKKYWHLIKKEVLVCVDKFFSNHCLLREHNKSFIALIPKASGSHTAHQFRPISLCNIVYKIISKILANRLKTTLPKIISPLQSAFVPKRNIQDNSILAHELLHSFKNKKGKDGYMFLKMDMEKAFDRMEWCLLLAIMEKLGFSHTWLSWIKICISTPSLSILLNGSPFGCISPGRGLRQGDHLSHFLFILGVKVFSRLMFKEERDGSIQGLKIARSCPTIHHLLFADDLLIFGKATASVAAAINSCLKKYCKWSGQLINSSKSSIRFSRNTWLSRIAAISVTFPYPSNHGISMHLGLPILMGNAKKRAFQGLIDKVKSKIEGWRAKTLSQASRLTLIKSIAAALPSYAMSTFLLPSSFCSKLDKIFKNFLWGFPALKKKNLSLKA
jgi:hypothetical protein